jgi:hypothetical protein
MHMMACYTATENNKPPNHSETPMSIKSIPKERGQKRTYSVTV